MNTLDFLIGYENDCLSFYQALEAGTDNPELKELYGLLADTRKRHQAHLELLKETLGGGELHSELTERAGHVINASRMVLCSHDMMKEMRNDRDGFEHVVHAEDEMIRLCEGMARVEESEAGKALLNWFVMDEKRCREEMTEIYEFVEAPHCYLEWGEFSNLHPL